MLGYVAGALALSLHVDRSDSISVRIAPRDPVAHVAWVAFDERGKRVDSGTAPEELMQPANGGAVVYCAESRGAWLSIEAVWRKVVLRATGPCTKLVAIPATGEFLTAGADDPRDSTRPR